jgi:CRP-like cAMP-binding protein
MNIFKNLHLELSKKFDLEKITLNNASLKRIYKLQKRSKKDNQILYNELQNLPCFQKILKNNENGELMYSNIIKRMEIKIIKGGEPLYRHKENITNMSFILEGRIVVYKKPKEYKIKKNKNQKNKFRFIDKIVNAFENSLSSHIFKNPDYFVNKGESYGFYDMKKQKREVLTEAASNLCIVGELNLNDYLVIFEKTEFLEKQDVLLFLGGLKIFENIYFDFFERIYNKITKKTYKKNEYACFKNSPCDRFIIIRKGSFKLYFNSRIKFLNYYDLSSFDNKELRTSGNTKKNLNYEINNTYDDNIEYQLINVGRGEIVGDIEFTYNIKNYFFNLKCDIDNSQILEIPINDLYRLSSRQLREQIKLETNEKIKLFTERIEEIKNVNLKLQTKQNQYKNVILLKINKSKGKIFEKIEKKEKNKALNQVNNKNFRLLYIKKNISLSTEKNNPKYNISNPSTAVSSKYLRKIKVPQVYEFHKILKNNHSNSNYLIKHNHVIKNRSNSAKKSSFNNISERNLFENKIKRQVSTNSKHSVIYEKEKKNFPVCFEINKKFVIHNNTSIISKSLKSIFMNQSAKDKKIKKKIL